MKEQSLPPPRALPHNIISTYELIQTINTIQILIVSSDGFRLVNCYFLPHIACLGFSYGRNLVTIDTALLSTHCKARQGGSLSQCILPLSNFFAIGYIYLVYIYLISNRFMAFKAVSSPFILWIYINISCCKQWQQIICKQCFFSQLQHNFRLSFVK